MSISLTNLPIEIYPYIGKFLTPEDYCCFSIVDQSCHDIACDLFFIQAVFFNYSKTIKPLCREKIIEFSKGHFVSKMGIKWKTAVDGRTKDYDKEILCLLPLVPYAITVLGTSLVFTETVNAYISIALSYPLICLGFKVLKEKAILGKGAQGAGETCARIWLSAKSPLRPKTIM